MMARFVRSFTGWFAGVLCLAGSVSLWAQTPGVSEILVSLGPANYTGFLLDSDLGNPTPEASRAVVHAALGMKVVFSGGSIAATYEIQFRLMNDQDQATPLEGAQGPLPYVQQTLTVRKAGVVSFVNVKAMATLRPASRLDEQDHYRVSAKVFLVSGADRLPRGSLTESAGSRYFHFANTASPDDSLNVLQALTRARLSGAYSLAGGAPAGQPALEVEAALARFDDFTEPTHEDPITSIVRVSLTDVTDGLEVPLSDWESQTVAAMASHTGAFDPSTENRSFSLPLAAADGSPFDPQHAYQATVALLHLEWDGSEVLDTTRVLDNIHFLALSGRLVFGPEGDANAVETTYTAVANDPAATVVDVGGELRARIALPALGGEIVGKPGFRFGDPASPLTVRLNPAGDAFVLADGGLVALTVAPPSIPDEESPPGGVSFVRENVAISYLGAHAEALTVRFPLGFAYADDPRSRVLRSSFRRIDLFLSPSLAPREDLPVGAPNGFAYTDRFPLRFLSPGPVWRIADGTLDLGECSARHVAADELEQLDALAAMVPPPVAEPDALIKASNDHVFRMATGTAGTPLIVRVGAQGEAVIDTSVAFQPGAFTGHFPLGWQVAWDVGGLMTVNANGVDIDASRLEGARDIAVSYQRNCSGGDCGALAPDASVVFTPMDGQLHFTADGGLRAEGVIPQHDLSWAALAPDQFAQQAKAFTDASLLFSGHVLDGEQSQLLPAEERAGGLLMSGVGRPGEPAYAERPRTTGYLDGFADYAGLNFRALHDADHQGRSRLAGQDTGDYPLTLCSKYYVRPGGVTGLHDAQSFPEHLELCSFDASIRVYSLSFLDGLNRDSRTDGRLTVPYPGNFSLEFDRLTFGCRGQLADARPAEGSPDLALDYWSTPFTPVSVEFRHAATAGCVLPTEGALALGVVVRLPLVPKPVHGVLGFIVRTPSPGVKWGDLTSASDKIGVDSRLELPTNLPLAGPGGIQYNFAPVLRAYFNRFVPNPPHDGFVNLVGRLNVPFFESVKTHIHAIPGLGDVGVSLMGGWNSANRPDNADRAWIDPATGNSFFNDSGFDADNRGFPPGLASVDDYRSPPGARFQPRAQHTWLDVIDLDYPVRWEGGLKRSFARIPDQDVDVDLKLVKIQSRVSHLSSSSVEIEFGAEVSKAPQFSVDQLLADVIDQRTGVFTALKEAMQDGTKALGITKAVEDLDALTRDRSEGLLANPFNRSFDSLVDKLYDGLITAYADGSKSTAQYQADVCVQTQNIVDGEFKKALDQMVGGIQDAESLLGDVHRRLGEAKDGVTSAQDVVTSQNGRHPVLALLAAKLAKNSDSASFFQQLTPDEVEAQVEKLGPTFEELHAQLGELAGRIGEAQAAVGPAGDLALGLNQILDIKSKKIDALRDRCRQLACDDLARITALPGRLLQENPRDATKARLKRVLLDELLSSFVSERFAFVLRAYLSESRGLFHQALDEIFERVNQALKEAVVEKFAGAAFPDDLRRPAGVLQNSFQAAKLHGHARWNGNSITEARVDGDLRLTLEDPGRPFGFQGHILVSEQQVDRPLAACRDAGDSLLKIEVGARASAVVNYGKDQKNPQGVVADVDLAVALKKLGKNVAAPIGLDGAVGLTGLFDVGDFQLKDARLKFAAGDGGNFLLGVAQGNLNGIDANVRAFIGQACRIDTLKVLDKAVENILALDDYKSAVRPGGGVIGFYVSADGEFPLEKLFGIPTTCALSLSGSGGNAYFGFLVDRAEGPSPALLAGYRRSQGLHGRLLCMVDATGRYDLAGAVGVVPLGRKLGFIPLFDARAHLSGVGDLGFKTPIKNITLGTKIVATLIPGPFNPLLGGAPIRNICYEVTVEDLVSAKGCAVPFSPLEP
ncbi:MAG: hypothetical protein HYR88_09515 [Verrucomicrobia bacterium]|nr:hypothetical protein [Verrucomicrobiota bacterium]